MTTSLYRFYDKDGDLLYVGISSKLGNRFHEHSKNQPWYEEIVGSTVEHYPTREAALEAERAAIKAERPEYNVVHNRDKAAANNGDKAVVRTADITPRTFDHEEIGHLPEYRALRVALSDLANALDDGLDPEIVMDALLTSYAGDRCDHCRAGSCFPYAGEVEGRTLAARYYCHQCHRQWPVWWSTDRNVWV